MRKPLIFISFVVLLSLVANGRQSPWANQAVAADASASDEPALRVTDLRCEYLQNPLAVDMVRPRLSWILESDQRGQRQTAYQVLVASTSEALAGDVGDLWDSGKVQSDQSAQVEYAGKPLSSRQCCFWKVRSWDKDGKPSTWSRPESWSMGLLNPDDWRAQWIQFPKESATAPAKEPAQPAARETFSASPWMRKTFALDAEPKRAMAYVHTLGYHELYVNGQKVGGDVLSPAVSDYRARSFYVTYDITPLLRKGQNCIGIWLGRGWHVAGQLGVTASGPVVRLQAEIDAKGKHTEVVSDATWKCAPSPYATLGPWQWDQYGGERYDARLEQPAWNRVECDERQWLGVQLVATSDARCESQLCPLNRIGQSIPAVACADLGDGRYEVDFGTNLSGWLRMRFQPLAVGQRVAIHYADQRYAVAKPEEMPSGVARHGSDATFASADGSVRYQTFHQADEFFSAGRPGEEFCSKFNYHGFRYAVIEGLPAKPELRDIEALLIESDLEPAGSFACSNELFNRIDRINLWTLRCLNLGGYMVDCPHRERMGYGDGQLSAESCLTSSWMPNFYAKWLGDWRDGQNPQTGDLPHVAPSNPGGGGPGWGGTMAAIAWRTYLYYGDRRLLDEFYEPMCRYVDFLESRCQDGILRHFGGEWDFLGDWVPPERGMDTKNWPSADANELFNNCYRLYLWELLEKSAVALGRPDEVRRCQAKLDQIRPLIHKAFYDPARHTYVLDEQAYQCFPLLTGVTPLAEQPAVLQKLENGIRIERGGHLDSGMLGTYFLLQYLPTVQRDDLLFTIVHQKTYPGWGYMVEQGATTLWEQWNGYYSQIHSCFTAIGGWFRNSLAGIQPDPASPGFKNIILRPAVVGDIDWVKGEYRSLHGTIRSDWRREKGTFQWTVTIPANCTATVHVPTRDAASVTEGGRPANTAEGVRSLGQESGCAVFAVESGTYCFTAAL